MCVFIIIYILCINCIIVATKPQLILQDVAGVKNSTLAIGYCRMHMLFYTYSTLVINIGLIIVQSEMEKL